MVDILPASSSNVSIGEVIRTMSKSLASGRVTIGFLSNLSLHSRRASIKSCD